MLFTELLDLLRVDLNRRIRNGEFTERNLGRKIGLSQTHIHNVLKGARAFSPDIADRILKEMHLTVQDLWGAGLGQNIRGETDERQAR
jgi:plasmid maintenance system antidote protein VapI